MTSKESRENTKKLEEAKKMKDLGNSHFKDGHFHLAMEIYSEAMDLCAEEEEEEDVDPPPLRDDSSEENVEKKEEVIAPKVAEKKEISEFAMLKSQCLSNRAACSISFRDYTTGYEDCCAAVKLNPCFVRAWMRKGSCSEKLEKWGEALEDYQKAVDLSPSELTPSIASKMKVLKKKADAQFEKDKEEMMGKLKSLGNMVLGNFGLSTDDFALQQDPKSGGYSIQFKGGGEGKGGGKQNEDGSFSFQMGGS